MFLEVYCPSRCHVTTRLLKQLWKLDSTRYVRGRSDDGPKSAEVVLQTESRARRVMLAIAFRSCRPVPVFERWLYATRTLPIILYD